MDADISTDRAALTRDDGYGTTGPLLTRASIYRYLEEPRDLVATVLAHVDLDGAAVLDVGRGSGQYLQAVERDSARLIVGLDLVVGMAQATREAAAARVVNGDAQALPFADATFDVVLAPHMLYHVPDIPAAVGELRRVLQERGTLLAVANGSAHLANLRRGLMAALADLTGEPPRPFRAFTDRFSLENGGELLGAAFGVETVPIRNRLVVPEPEPVVRYADTMRNMYGEAMFAGAPWSELLARFEQGVRDEIDRDGAWVTETESCVFVCTPA